MPAAPSSVALLGTRWAGGLLSIQTQRHTYMHTRVNKCTCARTRAHTTTCMRTHVHTMHTYTCTEKRTRNHAHTGAHAHMHAYKHACTCTHMLSALTNMCKHGCTCARTCTYKHASHACTHVYMHPCACMCALMCTHMDTRAHTSHTCMYVHTHERTCAHTPTHALRHTHTQRPQWGQGRGQHGAPGIEPQWRLSAPRPPAPPARPQALGCIVQCKGHQPGAADVERADTGVPAAAEGPRGQCCSTAIVGKWSPPMSME